MWEYDQNPGLRVLEKRTRNRCWNESCDAKGMMNKIFFFKQKPAYEILSGLVGWEMCIRDRPVDFCVGVNQPVGVYQPVEFCIGVHQSVSVAQPVSIHQPVNLGVAVD